ncbi:MAG: GtrA family protein [Pseudonocardia sp.]
MRSLRAGVPVDEDRAAGTGRATATVLRVPDRMASQLVRFAAIGAVSTLVHLGLYVLLRGLLHPLGANLIALLITAVGNTAANRRLTFGVRGHEGTTRHQVQGLIVLGLGLTLTSAALTALDAWMPDAGRLLEVAALVIASGIATVLRFVAFRSWIFRADPEPGPDVQHRVTSRNDPARTGWRNRET